MPPFTPDWTLEFVPMSLVRHASILSLTLAACAGSPQSQEASEQCRAKARLEAPLPPAFPQTGSDTTQRALTPEEERARNELAYFQKCMQDRGYGAKR